MTPRTRVAGAAWFHLAHPDSCEMALVLEHAGQLPADGGVIPPVTEAPTHASATPDGFERGQILATDEATVMQQREQDQEIGSQVGQLPVAAFVGLPTLLDACLVVTHALLPARKMRGQGDALL